MCTSLAILAPPAIVNAPPAVILDALLVLLILIPPDKLKAPVDEFDEEIVFVESIPESESTIKMLFPELSKHLSFIEDI
jgi:hypothetical protein